MSEFKSKDYVNTVTGFLAVSDKTKTISADAIDWTYNKKDDYDKRVTDFNSGITNTETINTSSKNFSVKVLDGQSIKINNVRVLDGDTYVLTLASNLDSSYEQTPSNTLKVRAAFINSNEIPHEEGKVVQGNGASSAAVLEQIFKTQNVFTVEIIEKSADKGTYGTRWVGSGIFGTGTDKSTLAEAMVIATGANPTNLSKNAPSAEANAVRDNLIRIKQNQSTLNAAGTPKTLEDQTKQSPIYRTTGKGEDYKKSPNDNTFNNRYLTNKFVNLKGTADDADKQYNVSEYTMKIGDVVLSIPPTHLTITQLRSSNSIDMLGYEAVNIASSASRVTFKINAIFHGREQIDNDLKRILVQFRYCPINIIHSTDLYEILISEFTWLGESTKGSISRSIIPVTMDDYTVYTLEGHPNTLGCSMQFSIFNYTSYFDGDHTESLKYTMVEFEDDFSDIKLSNKIRTTTHLEYANHPYNYQIEEILSNKYKLFFKEKENDLSDDSSLILYKLSEFGDESEISKALNTIDKEIKSSQNTVVLECHSMSYRFVNNFAWFPIVGYSQAVPQYIGPGQGVLSVNSKFFIDEKSVEEENKEQISTLSKLLKTYNEIREKNIHGFYDDRYLVYSSFTRFVESTICSIGDIVSSSVANHPGFMDVNIIFNKSSYAQTILEKNVGAAEDMFYGLQRVIKLVNNNKDLAEIVKNQLSESAIEAKAGKGIVGTWADRATPKIDISGTNDDLCQIMTIAVQDITSGFKKEKNDPKNARYLNAIDNIELSPISNFANIKGQIDKVLNENASIVDGKKMTLHDINSVYSIIDSLILLKIGIDTHKPSAENEKIYKEIACNTTRELFKQVPFIFKTESEGFRKEVIQQFQTVDSAINFLKDIKNKEKVANELASIPSQFNFLKQSLEKWNESVKDADKKIFFRLKSPAIAEKYTTEEGAGALQAIVEKAKKTLIPSGTEGKSFTVEISEIKGSNTVEYAAILKDSAQKTTAQLLTKIIKDTNSKKLDIKPLITDLKPYAAHNYYPSIDDFVKTNVLLSSTVGGWFYCKIQHSESAAEEHIRRLQKSVENSSSWVKDTKAWENYLPKKQMGQDFEKYKNDYISNGNPFSLFQTITYPTGRKGLDTTTYQQSEYRMTPSSVKDTFIATFITPPNGGSTNKPFSGLSDMIFIKGLRRSGDLYGDVDGIIKNMNNRKAIVFDGDPNSALKEPASSTSETNKVNTTVEKNSSNITQTLNTTATSAGIIVGQALTPRSAATTFEISSGIMGSIENKVDSSIKTDVSKNLTDYAMLNEVITKDPYNAVGTSTSTASTANPPTIENKPANTNNIDEIISIFNGACAEISKDPLFNKLNIVQFIKEYVEPMTIYFGDIITEASYIPQLATLMKIGMAYAIDLYSSNTSNANKISKLKEAKEQSQDIKTIGAKEIKTWQSKVGYPNGFNFSYFNAIDGEVKTYPSYISQNGGSDSFVTFIFSLTTLHLAKYRAEFAKNLLPAGTPISDVKAYYKENILIGFLPKDIPYLNKITENMQGSTEDKRISLREIDSLDSNNVLAFTQSVLDKINIVLGYIKKPKDEKFANKAKVIERFTNEMVRSKTVSEETKTYLINQLSDSFESTIGIQNAFPTFKLYVIISNLSDIRYSSLDAWYDFRLVQDMIVIKSKENPVHMLKCRVYIDPRFITLSPSSPQIYKDRNSFYEYRNSTPTQDIIDTPAENSFNYGRVPFRVGMRICLKLGYHSDPRQLDTVFIGRITQMQGMAEGGMYEVEALGDGVELSGPATISTQNMKGLNYTDIINQIFRANPNVMHFGRNYGTAIERFSREHLILFGICRAVTNGVVTGIDDIKSIFSYNGFDITSPFKGAATLIPGYIAFKMGAGAAAVATVGTAAAPAVAISGTVLWNANKFLNREYTSAHIKRGLNEWTKELLTRNSSNNETVNFSKWRSGVHWNLDKAVGQIAKHFHDTYKYDNNPIDDNIFAVDIWNDLLDIGRSAHLSTSNDRSIWDILVDIKRIYPDYALDVRPYGARSTLYLGPIGFSMWRTDDPIMAMASQMHETSNQNINYQTNLGKFFEDLAERNHLMDATRSDGMPPLVPFQRHHIAHSDSNIIMNGIQSTPQRGWNGVVVNWGKELNEQPINLIANAELHPDVIKKKVFNFKTCTDESKARAFALGCLKEGVEKMYGGTLVLKGNSKIEPYDKIYILDKVNKMYGWINVETVIHKFDSNFGFTTHITPNMVVGINTDAYNSKGEMLRKILSDTDWWNIGKSVAIGTGVSVVIGALAVKSAPVALIATALNLVSIAGMVYCAYDAVSSAYGEVLDIISGKSGSLEDTMREEEAVLQILYDAHMNSAYINGYGTGYIVGYVSQQLYGMRRYKSSSGTVGFRGFARDASLATQHGLTKAYNYIVNTKYGKFVTDPTYRATNNLNNLSSKLTAIRNKVMAIDTPIENIEADPTQIKTRATDLKTIIEEIKTADSNNQFTDKLKGLEDQLKSIEQNANNLKPKAGLSPEQQSKINARKASKVAIKPHMINALKGGLAVTGFELLLEGINMIPSMVETFMISSVTDGNCLTVYPLWHKNAMMTAGLDGWQKSNAFLYAKNMILNAKRVLGNIDNILLYQTPTFSQPVLENMGRYNSALSAPATSLNSIKGTNINNKIEKYRDNVKTSLSKLSKFDNNAIKDPTINKCANELLTDDNAVMSFINTENERGEDNAKGPGGWGAMQVNLKDHHDKVRALLKSDYNGSYKNVTSENLGTGLTNENRQYYETLLFDPEFNIKIGTALYKSALKTAANKTGTNCQNLYQRTRALYKNGENSSITNYNNETTNDIAKTNAYYNKLKQPTTNTYTVFSNSTTVTKKDLVSSDKSTITSNVGSRKLPEESQVRLHHGVDISANKDSKIMAATSGTVVFSGTGKSGEYGGYGNVVVIRSDDGTYTLYGHNNSNLVKKGDRINKGDNIALMGNTGVSSGQSGVHLHFQAWQGYNDKLGKGDKGVKYENVTMKLIPEAESVKNKI